MGRMQSVTECKNANQIVRVVERQGGRVDNGGRHYKVRDADGNGCVPVPRHAGDIPTGTRCSIIKALLALGFMMFPMLCALYYLFDYCATNNLLP